MMSRLKQMVVIAGTLASALTAAGQVPQFSFEEYHDWIYSNPGIELNETNIRNNRIYLYTNSQGQALTLTSPRFDCQAGGTIHMDITWVTDQWQTEGFVADKVALTAAIVNEQGVALDSVTYTPTAASLSRTNYVVLDLTVPHGTGGKARLRFASWRADVKSNGAVRKIAATVELRADVNNDGEVTVADVNAVVDGILGEQTDQHLIDRLDVNRDGEVTVADVNVVIDAILG